METGMLMLELFIAGGSFLGGVAVTMIGAAWRLRGAMEKAAEDAVREHLDTEHGKDSEGRTLRERIGLIEARCKERHE